MRGVGQWSVYGETGDGTADFMIRVRASSPSETNLIL